MIHEEARRLSISTTGAESQSVNLVRPTLQMAIVPPSTRLQEGTGTAALPMRVLEGTCVCVRLRV